MSDENFRYPIEPSCRKYLGTLPPGMGTGLDPIPYGGSSRRTSKKRSKQASDEKSPSQKAEEPGSKKEE